MSKLFAIVRREFIERVRTKAFLIGTFVGPLIFAGFGFAATSMFGAPSQEQPIAVIDATIGQVAPRLVDSLGRERVGQGDEAIMRYRFTTISTSNAQLLATRDSLLALVDLRDGRGESAPNSLVGILVVTDSGLEAGRLTYLGKNVSNLGEIGHFERGLRTAIVRERVRTLGLSDDVATAVTARVELTTGKVSKGALTGQGGEGAFMFSYVLVILLFIAMLPTGIQVMAAVVEEKSNRILEVLVSSVRPFDLMLGKVLGVGGASLLQIGIWGASASLLGTILGSSASPGAQMQAQASAQVATEGGAQAAFAFPTIAPDLIVITLLYFALGFLFFSTAYAAVGAMCNTVQETQQAAMPVTMMVMAGYIGSFLAIARPETMIAKVMTFLPFTAPFIVPTRWSNAPLPLPELLGSLTACVLGVLGMVWIAARIYRVGILSYGKKPTFRDMWVWIRHS